MLEKTFDPKAVEQRLYQDWEAKGAFSPSANPEGTPFTIMMPPPNVTGSLHMGHALNMTLQDVMTRYHRMRGRPALWQPGTDHAGIATQMVVERNLAAEGKTRHDLGRDAFIERVWQWKAESGNSITGQLRRLGASTDWTRERFTMDDGLSAAVIRTFVMLHKDGLIYRDKRLVNWDPKLHTAISDLEVEQKEERGHLWHFRYPLADDPSRHIVVATTRPETMLGDTAVAVHPDDDRYADMIGKEVLLPLVGRRIPIVADEWADPETGSGAVKITPAHDFNDFEVGRRHSLPMVNILDANACISDEAPEAYRGLDRYDARRRVVDDLEALGLVERIDDHIMMLPYGDRSGVVIEPWLTDQWFVDAATLAGPAMDAVRQGRTRFVPEQWTRTYFDWMENIQPWCISRQIWWGHQIPAWFGPDGQIFVEETVEEAKASARAHYGEDVVLTRETDVLDTWFSSALWPFSTLGWPEETPELKAHYPGSVLVTGFDIIFFWVARMMMMGLYVMKDVPFETVYIHALVRDAKGQKMSKSKGNVIDPLAVIDTYGADALRFTLVSLAAPGRDVKMSEQRVEGYRNFCTKLWNAARYCQMNNSRLDAKPDLSHLTSPANRWIVSELAQLWRQMEEAIAIHRYNDAANAYYHFVWGTFCDWYLEITKPLLAGGDSDLQEETRAVTGWVLNRLLHMGHPFIPFITEEIYGTLDGERRGWLIEESWPDFSDLADDREAREEIGWVIDLVSTVRSLRADMNVPAGARVPLLLLGANDETRRRVEANRDVIQRMARAEDIAFGQGEAPRGSVQDVVGEATLALPLAEIIDIDQERARLKKELQKLAGEISRFDAKLSNESFLAKAPEAVVEEQKERRAEAVSTRDKLQQALDRLDAA